MDDWFTNEGATGELEIERRNGSWFVNSPSVDRDFKCIIEDDGMIDESQSTQKIKATVSKFRRGMGGRASFLFLTSPSVAKDNTEGQTTASGDSSTDEEYNGRNNQPLPSNTRKLKDFSGSTDYANVEATVDAVFYVKKDTRGIPDIKGELTDDSVLRPVTFIVQDGVSHPYLGEGERFLFKNVKDYFYKKENEVQVVINDNTQFTEI